MGCIALEIVNVFGGHLMHIFLEKRKDLHKQKGTYYGPKQQIFQTMFALN